MKRGNGFLVGFSGLLPGRAGTAVSCRGRAFLSLISISWPEEAPESIPESRGRQHSLLTLLGSVSAAVTKGHMERAREVLCEMLSGQVQD